MYCKTEENVLWTPNNYCQRYCHWRLHCGFSTCCWWMTRIAATSRWQFYFRILSVHFRWEFEIRKEIQHSNKLDSCFFFFLFQLFTSDQRPTSNHERKMLCFTTIRKRVGNMWKTPNWRVLFGNKLPMRSAEDQLIWHFEDCRVSNWWIWISTILCSLCKA